MGQKRRRRSRRLRNRLPSPFARSSPGYGQDDQALDLRDNLRRWGFIIFYTAIIAVVGYYFMGRPAGEFYFHP
ncbi:MAG: hypothetical protein J6386_13675 [Candidatus Synoicihabitans palmerolidicus]|nr:hypothetical protein [Candidatus Synoicihabitans palmerolidicus]